MDDEFNGCDTQTELIELVHEPVNPARPGTPGEGIYLDLWRKYLAADENRLACILRNTLRGEPSQRQASVCASFMTFMGCNCGQGFTWSAERLAEGEKAPYGFRNMAFMAAWAVENRRSLGVNGGTRTIESMLCRNLWIDHPWRGRIVRWEALDEITTADYDTVDCMVEWWSGEDARQMRRIAESMIQAANRRMVSGMFNIKEQPHDK